MKETLPVVGVQEENIRSKLKVVARLSGESPLPPSQSKRRIEKLSTEELEEEFPLRLRIIRRLLREPNNERAVADARRWLRALNGLDLYIEKHRTGKERVLRERQATVFEDMRNFVEEGKKAGYIELPTGIGKTVLFIKFIEALDLKTLIVVPSKVLVGQTDKEFKNFAPKLDVGKIYQHAKEFGRKVTIITYASLANQLRNGKIKPKDYDCLILDEAHEALGEEKKWCVTQFPHALRPLP